MTRTVFSRSVAAILEFAGDRVDLDLVADFDEGGDLEFVLRVLQDRRLGELARRVAAGLPARCIPLRE